MALNNKLISWKPKGKKGMFFTLSALLFVTIMIGYIIMTKSYSDSESASVEQSRVLMLDELLKNIESDMQKAVYISCYRAITTAIQNSILTGETSSYIELEELALYGTSSGLNSSMMEGNSMNEWKSRVENITHDYYKTEVLINISSFSFSQESPWQIKCSAESRIILHDTTALFNKTNIANAYISILGFEDPLYSITTFGKVTNKIVKSNTTVFVIDEDTSRLMTHVVLGEYIESTSAPSFLGRLTGDMTASLQGIESLVYIPKLAAAGEPVLQKSVVDYIYFSDNNPPSHRIQNMPDWFMLDDNHLETYQSGGIIR